MLGQALSLANARNRLPDGPPPSNGLTTQAGVSLTTLSGVPLTTGT